MTLVFDSVQGDKDHPICPVMLTDEKLASTFSEHMLGKNKSLVWGLEICAE